MCMAVVGVDYLYMTCYGVNTYIWHGTDVYAEYPRLQRRQVHVYDKPPFFKKKKVYKWPKFSDTHIYAHIFRMKGHVNSNQSILIFHFLLIQVYEWDVFSMARYIVVVSFKILARTPIPKLPPSYPSPHYTPEV